MNKVLYIFTCVCAMALVASCGSSKRLSKEDVIVQQAEAENAMMKVRFEESVAKAGEFTTMQSKVKYAFNGKSLSGRFFVESGKRLCMTAAVLGIEVFRIEANEQTVTIVDKFDKLYSRISVKEFAEKMGMQNEMQYDALESLLLGKMFIPGVGVISAKDFGKFAWKKDDETGVMTGVIDGSKYALSYDLNAENNLAKTQVNINKGGEDAAISCEYSAYEKVENAQFATAEKMTVVSEKMNLNASLSLSGLIAGKNWNDFKPSDQYKEVGVEAIIEAVKNMK